jgi:diguanylate cyclase (GGDEF)-like protein/PAS domain S-box-containing protein
MRQMESNDSIVVEDRVRRPSEVNLRPRRGGHGRDRRSGIWVVGALRRWLPKGGALPDAVWAQRHRAILVLLWLHVPGLFLFSLARRQSVLHSLLESAGVAVFASIAVVVRRQRRLATVLTALGLLTSSAALVHMSGGLIEMHFHYFVMIGVVTLYQDWRPFLVAIGWVVFQHGVAGVLDPAGVYNHQAAIDHPWRWAGVHGLFIAGMSAAGIASWRLNEALLGAASDREERLAEAQEVARLGSWEWDLTSGRVSWSDQLCRLLGVDPDDLTPSLEAFLSRVHPEDRDAVDAEVRGALVDGTPHARDFRVLLPDGTTGWVHGRGQVTVRVDGRPAVMSGTVQDVTERKRAEAELREALSLLSATLDSTADGILVVDHEGRIRSCNRKFAEMWRLPENVLVARDVEELRTWVLGQVREPEAFLARLRKVYSQPEAESHDTVEFLDGRIVERYSQPQRVDGATVGRVLSFRDVTERSRLEHELAHQAFHDSLTNLANQALFRDRVEHALARAARHGSHLAVLFVDLDNFKTVNDSLGHTVGDELLVAMAERLRGCVRATDTAARLGGDEFAVLLEDLESVSDATGLADRLIARLHQPFTVAGKEVFVGASIGIAFDAPATNTGQLLGNADIAMYTAKRRGKGRYELFETEMRAAAGERLEIEADLRRAVERGELTLQYQPIIALDTGRISGAEALIRWRHPQRGMLPPDTFIPIAEETGLIRELGRQVLNAACMQARRWQLEHRSDPPLTVSVNLSPRQLQSDELIAHVTDALEASGLPASSLILEITEGAVMHDAETSIRRLRDLKALGVRLAVDDFGTGYSSLSYLQRFPIDILKIDRAFVATIGSDDSQSSLVPAIVSLAKTMRLQAVAEGVETATQADFLARLGCDLAQGYHLARPMDVDALEDLLRSGLSPALRPVPSKPPALVA